MAIMSLADADYALLTHVPPMLGASPNPFAALAVRPCGANAHGLALGQEWEAFYAGRRSAKTRGRLRGKERALAQSGPIEFSEITDTQQRAALATEMMALKAAQLTATAGLFNTFARRSVQDFFRALAGEADTGVLVFRLSAGGRLVAAALGVVRQGCFYYQVPVYPDDALQRHSPGHILLMRLMQWAIERGCTRFDFTIGDEPYKAEWCDQTWVLGCGTLARTLRGRVGAGIALAQIAAMRQVKRRRGLYALAVRIRTALGKVRQVLGAVHG
jgi:CelD/BcsL family acetyltransferase involved in cellulose biosynthesis